MVIRSESAACATTVPSMMAFICRSFLAVGSLSVPTPRWPRDFPAGRHPRATVTLSVVVLAPLTRSLASTIRTGQGASPKECHGSARTVGRGLLLGSADGDLTGPADPPHAA